MSNKQIFDNHSNVFKNRSIGQIPNGEYYQLLRSGYLDKPILRYWVPFSQTPIGFNKENVCLFYINQQNFAFMLFLIPFYYKKWFPRKLIILLFSLLNGITLIGPITRVNSCNNHSSHITEIPACKKKFNKLCKYQEYRYNNLYGISNKNKNKLLTNP